MLVNSGLSDFNRRLTILSPVVSDAGYYECEAVLRSSSVPSVSAGAYLHVQGKNKAGWIRSPPLYFPPNRLQYFALRLLKNK